MDGQVSWIKAKSVDEIENFYKSVLPAIKEIAKTHGYAIGVHGSMRRDLDLIAVPWVETFSDKNTLAKAIQETACGFYMADYNWEEKPHGRTACAFPICTIDHKTVEIKPSIGHVDLSVIGSREGTDR